MKRRQIMRRGSSYLLTLIAFIHCCAFASLSEAAVGDVVATIPDNTQDNDVGITFLNGHLWVAGHFGKLYEVDPSSGQILKTVTTSFTHGFMGLANDGASLYVVNHQDGKIYHLGTNGVVKSGTFVTPNPQTSVERGQKGLTLQAPGTLWYADNFSKLILKINKLGTIIHGFKAPGSSPQGLTWDGEFLWHFDNVTDKIYQLDPVNGKVITSFPAPFATGEGDLAFDGTYLWYSSNEADKFYKIDIGLSPARFALRFDGSQNYVQVPNSAAFYPTNLTVEAWVKFPVNPTGDNLQYFIDTTGDLDDNGFGLTWEGRNVGEFRALIRTSSGLAVAGDNGKA